MDKGNDKQSFEDIRKELEEQEIKKRQMQIEQDAKDKSLFAKLRGLLVGLISLARDVTRAVLFGPRYAMQTRDETGEKIEKMKNAALKEWANRDVRSKEKPSIEESIGKIYEEPIDKNKDASIGNPEKKDTKEDIPNNDKKQNIESSPEHKEIGEREKIFNHELSIAEKEEERRFKDYKQELLPQVPSIREQVMDDARKQWMDMGDIKSMQGAEIVSWIATPKSEQEAFIHAYCQGGESPIPPTIANIIHATDGFQEIKLNLTMDYAKENGIERTDGFSEMVQAYIKMNPDAISASMIAETAKDMETIRNSLNPFFEIVKAGNAELSDSIKKELETEISSNPLLQGFSADDLWTRIASIQNNAEENDIAVLESRVVFEIAEEGITLCDMERAVEGAFLEDNSLDNEQNSNDEHEEYNQEEEEGKDEVEYEEEEL